MPIATPPRVRLRCLSADKLPRKTATKRAQEKRIGRIMMFTRALAALVLAAPILAAETSSAQTYPSHPITLVAPFPPGGATDTIARIMQDSMSKSLGQQIIFEERRRRRRLDRRRPRRPRRARRLYGAAAQSGSGNSHDAVCEARVRH